MPGVNIAAREAAENTRPLAKYTYNYDYLPPLAMVEKVTGTEAFAARPDWLHEAARPALAILFNSIMIGVEKTGDEVEFVQRVIKSIQAVARELNDDAGRDLSNAIAKKLDEQSSPPTLPQLKELLEDVIDP